MTQLALRTDVYAPKIENGKDTGLLSFVKQRTYADLHDQLINVLTSIQVTAWGYSAKDGLEYLSYDTYRQDTSIELPKGTLRVMVYSGSNEGERITILIQETNTHKLIPILSLKYLSDRDSIWLIAKDLEQACNDGMYGY
jgi:hypothetical protein